MHRKCSYNIRVILATEKLRRAISGGVLSQLTET